MNTFFYKIYGGPEVLEGEVDADSAREAINEAFLDEGYQNGIEFDGRYTVKIFDYDEELLSHTVGVMKTWDISIIR